MLKKDLVRFAKLEAIWILINVSYGEEKDIIQIFDDQFEISTHINSILESSKDF